MKLPAERDARGREGEVQLELEKTCLVFGTSDEERGIEQRERERESRDSRFSIRVEDSIPEEGVERDLEGGSLLERVEVGS